MTSAPRLVSEPDPAEAVVASDQDLGHRIPAVRTPGKIAAMIAALTMPRDTDPPFIPEAELLALLTAMRDRYAVARQARLSVTVTFTVRIHDGRHRELREGSDRRLG